MFKKLLLVVYMLYFTCLMALGQPVPPGQQPDQTSTIIQEATNISARMQTMLVEYSRLHIPLQQQVVIISPDSLKGDLSFLLGALVDLDSGIVRGSAVVRKDNKDQIVFQEEKPDKIIGSFFVDFGSIQSGGVFEWLKASVDARTKVELFVMESVIVKISYDSIDLIKLDAQAKKDPRKKYGYIDSVTLYTITASYYECSQHSQEGTAFVQFANLKYYKKNIYIYNRVAVAHWQPLEIIDSIASNDTNIKP